MSGVSKSFGATQALEAVDLTVERGEIHALIGENGAGKSTLMRVLSGVFLPDAGTMEIDGEAFCPADPLEARRRGVAMIYQDLALAPHLPVTANILLGVEPARRGWLARGWLARGWLARGWLGRGWLDHGEAARLAGEALATLGHAEISLEAPTGTLSAGAQQIVEVARALVTGAKIVVFDEPTSSLTRRDSEKLFEVIRTLSRRGVAVVYISHFLEEVEEIAHTMTVLRDGRPAGSGKTGQTPRRRIIQWMVGRELKEMFPRVPHEPGEPILELEDLAAEGVGPAGLTLHRGEIFGIAGLIDAGRTELLRAIFGLSEVREGRIRLAGLEGPASPAERLRQGAGFLSEDRKNEGLAMSRSVEENLVLSRLTPYSTRGWLDNGAISRAAAAWVEKLGVKTASVGAAVASLSGGNQQKVQLARLLHHDCDVLLLDEPTRGIDVASKVVIYEWIGRLAAAGKAVLFVSSYIPELLGICDRIAVMSRGRLGEAASAEEWDEHKIMLAAMGGGDAHESEAGGGDII
jgi:ribose transport system ATP-binding protein